MNTQDKVFAAVAVSLAVPFLAAVVLPVTLAIPLSLVVPFVALSHLEPLERRSV